MGQTSPATTTQNSTTTPWSAATPFLNNLIGAYSSTPLGATSNENNAATNLVNASSNLPNFGDTATSGVTNALTQGTSTAPQLGMLNTGLTTLQNNLGSTASGANLNPYTTPGFGDALGTLTSDITNNVKSLYAASGRDPAGSGSFAQSLGRGLMQGEAPVIQSQYNTNEQNMLGANQSLQNAAMGTASGVNATNAGGVNNLASAINSAGLIPNLYTAPASTQLSAAQTQQQLPYSALLPALTAGTTLGGMGSESSGTGTQTPANNPLMNILGGVGMLGGLAGKFMMSDERVKEDIEPVGELKDGTTVYSYRYAGTSMPQIGLLAQDVEQRYPEAVREIGGIKHVNYERATRTARRLGMLEAA